MLGFKNPNNISNLTLWWDASDASTINNGRVINLDNVSTWTDKVSGIKLTNANGTSGPTYSFGAINGNNAISFPHYSVIPGNTNDFGNPGSVKTLINTNMTQFNTKNKTIFVVFKPTTVIQADFGVTNRNTKYAFGIWGSGHFSGLNQQPDIALISGSGVNPYTQYFETVSPWTTAASRNLNNWNDTAFKLGASLGQTQLFGVKTLDNGSDSLGKFVFLQENGLDSRYSFRPDTSRTTGSPVLPASPHRLAIGGYVTEAYTKFGGAYPMEGFFCEFIYFNRTLTSAEFNGVEAYLRNKWFA